MTPVNSIANTLHQSLKSSMMQERQVWAKQIVDEGVDLKELCNTFLYADKTTALRFSWLLSDIGNYNAAKLHIILPYIFEKREQTSIENFHYQFVKYWSIAGIPKENIDAAANLLFNWLNSSHTNVSIKAHSMLNLYTLTKDYPDLRNELISSIENQLNKTSVSFRTKATKILRYLKTDET